MENRYWQRGMQGLRSSLVAMGLLLFCAGHASAVVPVFLDYSGFTTRLNQLTSGVGVPNFTVAEQDTIKSGILSSLQTSFTGFDVTFSETSPGGPVARLWFGDTGGGFGVADHIDYRNKDASDLARVFTAEFGSFIEAGEPRSQQINELTMSLAGTSAHELGHNLGLRHHDSYGDQNQTYVGNPVGTLGRQNTHIMATGSTGLNEAGRESQRTFSEHAKVKLSFAADLTSSVPATINETADFGDDTASATPLSFTNLTAVSRSAVNVAGQIGNNTDADVFSFTLEAGSRFSADVNIDFPGSVLFENVDTFMELIDTNGNTVIASDDVSNYQGDVLGTGNSGDGFDPWLLNIPITSSGTYFLRLTPETPDTGDYELLLHTDPQSTTISPDFSGDGLLNCSDIDVLVSEIASGNDNAAFDLTGDDLVNLDDRDSWLAQAGAANLPSGNSFLLGDANLDGVVDAIDFSIWSTNRFTTNAAWCSGDFNAQGIIDAVDFSIWNKNRFTSSDDLTGAPLAASGAVERLTDRLIDLHSTAAVPEPAAGWLALVAWIGMLGSRRV